LATSPPTLRVTALPQSPADWMPLLVAAGILVALSVGTLDKYVIDGARVATPPVVSPSVATPVETLAPVQLAVSGRVGSLRLAAVTALPKRPGKLRSHPSCPTQLMLAESAAAAAATKAGWRVVRDQDISGYQLVVVDAGIERVRRGRCLPSGMSLLIFRGTKLAAIAYSRNGPKAVWLTSVEQIAPNTIQLNGADEPAALLRLDPNAIQLTPLK